MRDTMIMVATTNSEATNSWPRSLFPEALPASTSVAFSVGTGGTARADELAYDPKDQEILIANADDKPPFVTFISTKTHIVLGRIVYDGTLGNPMSTNGIEQPVWDAFRGKFYISIPATAGNPKGEVDEIDPISEKVTREFPTTCGPAGLALIPDQASDDQLRRRPEHPDGRRDYNGYPKRWAAMKSGTTEATTVSTLAAALIVLA
jgi:hypothetical protein